MSRYLVLALSLLLSSASANATRLPGGFSEISKPGYQAPVSDPDWMLATDVVSIDRGQVAFTGEYWRKSLGNIGPVMMSALSRSSGTVQAGPWLETVPTIGRVGTAFPSGFDYPMFMLQGKNDNHIYVDLGFNASFGTRLLDTTDPADVKNNNRWPVWNGEYAAYVSTGGMSEINFNHINIIRNPHLTTRSSVWNYMAYTTYCDNNGCCSDKYYDAEFAAPDMDSTGNIVVCESEEGKPLSTAFRCRVLERIGSGGNSYKVNDLPKCFADGFAVGNPRISGDFVVYSVAIYDDPHFPTSSHREFCIIDWKTMTQFTLPRQAPSGLDDYDIDSGRIVSASVDWSKSALFVYDIATKSIMDSEPLIGGSSGIYSVRFDGARIALLSSSPTMLGSESVVVYDTSLTFDCNNIPPGAQLIYQRRFTGGIDTSDTFVGNGDSFAAICIQSVSGLPIPASPGYLLLNGYFAIQNDLDPTASQVRFGGASWENQISALFANSAVVSVYSMP